MPAGRRASEGSNETDSRMQCEVDTGYCSSSLPKQKWGVEVHMWWAADNDRERQLALDMGQLKGWFANFSWETAPLVWGYGSAWDEDGAIVPLAMLNSDYFSNMP